MKRYIFYCLSVYTAFVLTAAAAMPAQAQRHEGYCDGSRTTADALACVNRHKADVQKRLNSIFDEAKKLSGGRQSGPLLTAAQNAWITYRDAQCAWESGLAENPSLERIYELSCVTLLTNLRADLLATTLETESNGQPREFGATPRWMNVLIHDHPDIFWKFGRWQHANLDCAGPEEQAVLGVRFSAAETADIVLAVAENPLTGKPSTQIMSLPVRPEKAEGKPEEKAGLFLCATDITLSRVPYNDKDGTAPPACHAIRVDDRKCAPLYLYWDGQEYRFADVMPAKASAAGAEDESQDETEREKEDGSAVNE